MKNILKIISLTYFFIALPSGCNISQSASVNNKAANTRPTVKVSPTFEKTVNANQPNRTVVPDSEEGSEITACSPNKLYQGETLSVSLRTPHGGYAAIKRLTDNRWFFLYGVEKSEPVWDIDSFTKIPEIKINTTTAINTTNSGDDKTPEKIFSGTGRYQLMVSNEDFGQDDPLWTGICEVEYVNQKRPK